KDPQSGVLEIAARDKPFASFVHGRQHMCCCPEKLQLRITVANRVKSVTEISERGIMRIKQPALRQKRMRERVVSRAFDDFSEFGAGYQQRMNIHAVGIERHVRLLHFLIVDGNEHKVDIRLCPYRVVRKAAAENSREYRAIVSNLRHK